MSITGNDEEARMSRSIVTPLTYERWLQSDQEEICVLNCVTLDNSTS
jgi:hypothetical protein